MLKLNLIYKRNDFLSQFHKIHFDTVDSTSNYAKANADKLSLPALVTADEQTNGRGRHGNSFFSPKDTGLYMTLLIPAPQDCSLITPAAAVAVCQELEMLGVTPKIKWVNDIFCNNKKVCGILTELYSKNDKTYVSVGIGINLTTPDFPSEIPMAGSLDLCCNKSELAERIAKRLLTIICSDDIISEYRKRMFIIGKTISYKKNNVSYTATAVDINESCNLIVMLSDGTKDILSSGEISIKF